MPSEFDTWWVTVAHYEYDNDNVIYAGILRWDLRYADKGEEYGEFSWGILISNNEEN